MAEERQKPVLGLYNGKMDGTKYKTRDGEPFLSGVVQKTVTLHEGDRLNMYKNTNKEPGDKYPDWQLVPAGTKTAQDKPKNEGDVVL